VYKHFYAFSAANTIFFAKFVPKFKDMYKNDNYAHWNKNQASAEREAQARHLVGERD
jgi:hypothetical protein